MLAKGRGGGADEACSAVEVLRKVLEVDFVRKLKASGFVERVYLEFRKAEAGDGDRVRLCAPLDSHPLISLIAGT